MAHAREALGKQRLAAAKAKAKAEKAAQAEKDRRLAESFPEVARLCQITVPLSSTQPAGELTLEKGDTLARASFLSNVPRGIGVKFDRLVTFAYNLTKSLQSTNLGKLLCKCAMFRALASDNADHVVSLGYSHESDSTQQQVAQHLIQRFGRPASKRLPTEVLNQRGTLTALLTRVDKQGGEVLSEQKLTCDWHSQSVVLLGKTSGFILRALELGMPFKLGTAEWDDWSLAIAVASDVLVVDQHGDKGSNNMPAFKDIACSFADVRSTANDMSPCEIHSLQAVKNSVAEVKADVGMLFCLANVSGVGSFHNILISVLIHNCHTTVRRIVAPPPADERHDRRLLLDCLYKLDAPHHARSEGRESTLVKDLKALADTALYEVSGLSFGGAAGGGGSQKVRVHFCWREQGGGPCCSNEDDCQEKVAVARVNFHGSSAFDRPSLARFTNVAAARKRVIVGFTDQNLYGDTVVACCKRMVKYDADGNPEIPVLDKPELLGSGEGDLKATTQTRCNRLCNWFGTRDTYFRLPIAEAMESLIDDLQYAFFGQNRKSISAEELLHVERSPLLTVFAALWALMASWTPDKAGPWRVLPLSGWKDFDAQDARFCARAHCLGILAMLLQRYDRRFATWPWLLMSLVLSWVPLDGKVRICEMLIEKMTNRPCCVPLFAREFFALYPTLREMLSAKAAATIKVWMFGKKFSTKASELGHAGERKALSAAAAPGRSFVQHSRRHLLQTQRIAHIAAGGIDPVAPVKMRGKFRGTRGDRW
jgi:hypothetical protein